jgi:hypothetical protein
MITSKAERKMKVCFLIIIFLVGVLVNKTFSSNHYIDKNATGLNNGTSWVNAWESFSAIDWNGVNPGDIIYISGGSDSTIYNEQFNVSASGTAGNLIVITRGIENGHSGKVIIDGLKTFFNVINITNKEYIVVSNLYLRNSDDSVIKIRNSQHIRIENCAIHMTARSGINIMFNENVIITGCTLTTDTFIPHQTDGIYSQENSNNIYENNYIVISNNDPDGHDDCIQSYSDYPLIIRDNYLEQNNSKTSNAQGIYITAPLGSDTTRIYNNIFNATLSASNGISYKGGSGSTSARAQIIGNTVYGKNLSSQYYITSTSDPIIKNNIGYSVNGNGILRLVDISFSDPNNVDNNIWKCNDNSPVSMNSSGVSWSSWQSSGFDLHSYITNPRFNDIPNSDFTLQASSDGIDHGQSLYHPYNSDFDGILRPRGLGWDIGAYESDFSASIGDGDKLPFEYKLFQNYPNPFNPSTTIKYTIQSSVIGSGTKQAQLVTLKVYDILGNEVAILVNEEKPTGTYHVSFNATQLTSGVYFYKLEMNDIIDVKKMILLK